MKCTINKRLLTNIVSGLFLLGILLFITKTGMQNRLMDLLKKKQGEKSDMPKKGAVVPMEGEDGANQINVRGKSFDDVTSEYMATQNEGEEDGEDVNEVQLIVGSEALKGADLVAYVDKNREKLMAVGDNMEEMD